MAECRNVTDSVLLTAVQWPKLLVISLNDDDVPVPGQSSLSPIVQSVLYVQSLPDWFEALTSSS